MTSIVNIGSKLFKGYKLITEIYIFIIEITPYYTRKNVQFYNNSFKL
jgi:hypothetical protein